MRRCASCEATLEADGWNCPACTFVPSIVEGVTVLAPDLARGNPQDAEYGYAELHAAERTHFWFTNRSQLIAWAARRYFPGATSFFDVGCGTGGVLDVLRSCLPGMRLAGADALLAGLAFARRQLPDVAFVQVDIRRLPYDRQFDVIGVFDVLEHLDDDEQALRELYRSTTVGGGLIVTVPQHVSCGARSTISAITAGAHAATDDQRDRTCRLRRRAGDIVHDVDVAGAADIPYAEAEPGDAQPGRGNAAEPDRQHDPGRTLWRRAGDDRSRDVAAGWRVAAGGGEADLMSRIIPFNKPFVTGNELAYIQEAIVNGHLSGNGPFTKKCQAWIEERLACRRALLTHSCTAGLEMAALLTDVGPGDEVIMPSFTFVSTANAFVLRGATPVFVDIRDDTEPRRDLASRRRSPRAPARSAGPLRGAAARWTFRWIAREHRLFIIEDVAQGDVGLQGPAARLDRRRVRYQLSRDEERDRR